MNERLVVRQALRDELTWVNDRYSEVGFVPSGHQLEVIAIAEVNGSRSGLGRLVSVDYANYELGGMYVLPEYRKHGVAKSIVEFLLERPLDGKNVFCLPFAHLSDFYQRFGFNPCSRSHLVPKDIKEKHDWCNKTYEHETLLFVLDQSR